MGIPGVSFRGYHRPRAVRVWPCLADVLTTGGYCYYHHKILAGLITSTRWWERAERIGPVELDLVARAEAAENLVDYYAPLPAQVAGDPLASYFDDLV